MQAFARESAGVVAEKVRSKALRKEFGQVRRRPWDWTETEDVTDHRRRTLRTIADVFTVRRHAFHLLIVQRLEVRVVRPQRNDLRLP